MLRVEIEIEIEIDCRYVLCAAKSDGSLSKAREVGSSAGARS